MEKININGKSFETDFTHFIVEQVGKGGKFYIWDEVFKDRNTAMIHLTNWANFKGAFVRKYSPDNDKLLPQVFDGSHVQYGDRIISVMNTKEIEVNFKSSGSNIYHWAFTFKIENFKIKKDEQDKTKA